MRIEFKNNEVTESFSVHFHANNKKPAYFDAAQRAYKNATINGEKAILVLHPKRDSSNRVNFIVGDKNVAVDNEKFRNFVAGLITAQSTRKLTITTAEGRVVKAKAEEGAQAPTQQPEAAEEPEAKAPAYQKPMGKAALIAAASQPTA